MWFLSLMLPLLSVLCCWVQCSSRQAVASQSDSALSDHTAAAAVISSQSSIPADLHGHLQQQRTEEGEVEGGGEGLVQDLQAGDRVRNFELAERLDRLGSKALQPQYPIRYHFHHGPHHDDDLLKLDEGVEVLGESRDAVTPSIGSRHHPALQQCLENSTFCMEEHIFHGGHGEIWRAYRIDEATNEMVTDELYVMKRMITLNRPDILRCALREIYFGKLLQNRSSFPRFITHFTVAEKSEYWLIYRYEGISLQKLISAIENQTSDMMLLKPSNIWKRLRTTKSGSTSLKGMMFQLISNVAELHSLGIVHRDIKPSNILFNVELKPKLILADFSSAMNQEIAVEDRYYPAEGPSTKEATLAYAPPEVLLSMTALKEGASLDDLVGGIAYYASRPESYDIWSVGVVFLELLLGTSDIFNVDQRTASMIKLQLRKRNMQHPTLSKNALLLASYADYCIYEQPR